MKRILEAVQKTQNTVQKKSYLINLTQIALEIKNDLETQKYYPKKFSCFAVQDPKIREIFAPHYKDRIVHHFLVNQLEKIIDPHFIFDSFANRKQKGCHVAVKRLRSFVRNPQTEYYIQLDINSFFTSINKKILFEIIKKHLQNYYKKKKNPKMLFQKNKLIKICRTIIFHNPTNPEPVYTGVPELLKLVPLHKSLFACPEKTGLPIGSLTSQFFANVYLNELDQFIKHKLKVKFYLRYIDDFVLLAKTPQELNKWKSEIDLFLQTRLKLYLHPKKIKLQHKSKGIDFLGYLVKPNYFLVRKRIIKSFKRRLYFFNHLLDPVNFPIINPPALLKLTRKFREKKLIPPVEVNEVLLHQMLSVINAYYGIFKFARSFRLRQKLYYKHFHKLKSFFEPKKQNWETMQIKTDLIGF